MVDLAEEEAESQVLEVTSPEVPYQKPHHQQNHLVEVLPDAVGVEEEAVVPPEVEAEDEGDLP